MVIKIQGVKTVMKMETKTKAIKMVYGTEIRTTVMLMGLLMEIIISGIKMEVRMEI